MTRTFDTVPPRLRIAASPLRIDVVDAFTGSAPVGPLRVELQRLDAGSWTRLDHPHHISRSGALGFVNLGRSHRAGASFAVRARVSTPGTIGETDAGDEWFEATIPTWDRDVAPPVVSGRYRLFPAPSYSFPAGVPLASGRVVTDAGAAAPGAAVTCDVTVRGRPTTEEVRTDHNGWFRLPLRWASGVTTIDATRDGLAASIDITVPDHLSTTHLLTLS